jgi:hypothetical protein
MSKAAQELPQVVRLVLRALPWIILATGLTAAYLSYQRIYDRYRFDADGIATSGVVVWASTIGTGTSNQSFRIRVVYRDTAEREWTRYFTVFSSQYREGQAVDVVYLPTNPEIAALGSKEAGETHGQDVLAAVISAIAILVGGIMVWLRRKRSQFK